MKTHAYVQTSSYITFIILNILYSIMLLIRYLLQSDFLKQISLFLAPDLLCVEMTLCRNNLFLITVT